MKTSVNKYHFVCKKCGRIIDGFTEWFANQQQCPVCQSKWVDVQYNKDISDLLPLLSNKNGTGNSVFYYFDFLPLIDKANIISVGEGIIPVDRWEFFEDYAKEKFGINCRVLAYRNDLNNGTGTFKDVAGAVVASVLKEHGIKNYVVASTGNIANAFAFYLSLAGINLSVFIPQDALKANEAEVSSYGQKVFRVNGDYAMAKKIAAQFAQKNGFLISGGNIDPMRVEAKKTMVFEWLRLLGSLPTVYIQSLSGGTGPIAIEKAIADLEKTGVVKSKPRHILVQPHRCAPMAHAYKQAAKDNFPDGFENRYPVYENPFTKVPTLATGNPATYPILSRIVKDSGGDIIEFDEDKMVDVARLIAYETQVRIGPASAIAVGGFINALKTGLIKQNDVVMINIGEGVRRSPEFMEEMIYTTEMVDNAEQCLAPDRKNYQQILWGKINF